MCKRDLLVSVSGRHPATWERAQMHSFVGLFCRSLLEVSYKKDLQHHYRVVKMNRMPYGYRSFPLCSDVVGLFCRRPTKETYKKTYKRVHLGWIGCLMFIGYFPQEIITNCTREEALWFVALLRKEPLIVGHFRQEITINCNRALYIYCGSFVRRLTKQTYKICHHTKICHRVRNAPHAYQQKTHTSIGRDN